MDSTKIISEEFVKSITISVKNIFDKRGVSHLDIDSRLTAHFRFVMNWSSTVHAIGMSKPKDLDNSTIPLPIKDVPRKFRHAFDDNLLLLSEIDIINSKSNYVILGAPGSGKTTTLQRLCRIIISGKMIEHEAQIKYPIVIRLRDIGEFKSICIEIAEVVGLDLSHIKNDKINKNEAIKNINYIIYDFLENTQAIVMIDGIDEIDYTYRQYIENELSEIGNYSGSCKIIATCRSGDYSRVIKGFHAVEIAPLRESDRKAIIEMWAEQPSEFEAALEACSYIDTVDRPLFLTQIIQIFNARRFLPPKPVDIYRRIVNLILEDWDKDRAIFRRSRYSMFDIDEKRNFLASLAFHLTYKIHKKTFTTDDLINTYRNISTSFGLPQNEAEHVAAEIESHNGLILKSSFDNFEFSHLSLQEYLAADYIVRSPMDDNIKKYLRSYPAPVAIAVALSSNPSDWLASLLLKSKIYLDIRDISLEMLQILVSRIVTERPGFSENLKLGIAILKLLDITRYSENVKNNQFMSELFLFEEILKSISIAVDRYYAEEPEPSDIYIHLIQRRDIPEDPYYIYPDVVYVCRNILRKSGNMLPRNITLAKITVTSRGEQASEVGETQLQLI